MRTCIATRQRHPRSSLLRVVCQDGALIADPNATMPGRGAWITPSLEAFDVAASRRAFARALRVNVVDTGHVRTYLAEHALRTQHCKEDRPLMSAQQ
ncbi:YlxR family protein [Corynebacterium tapiri]|uniref:YlxR family protein n=1 Tax=Corynebacterium tapiri TaxID=1448266 RepID=A0A5C4U5J1_9CORY|nr:YlxR family protein [Corynebacterium tapiri]TNL99456.1 YlxR family protein [Corynebacterium tapiri]